MKLVKDIRGDAAILTLKGEFDSFVCNPFIEQIDSLIEGGVTSIVLNMRLIKFINSTGIGSIIKCRKKLRERDGNLVISKPSGFVREVLQNLGLSEVVLKIFESDEEALDHFNASDGIEMEDSNNIMVHPVGESGSPVIGRIRKLDEDGLVFETEQTEVAMETGAQIRLKFRLPLFKKSHYFDLTAEVSETVHSSSGLMITSKFAHIFEEDRKSITQFVKDMQFLRKEARES